VSILILSYLFIGLVRFAEMHSRNHNVGKSVSKPFLGFTEGATVLVSVLVLFGIFVIIQFRYLFSGEMNITAAGFTYSEYARRGFGELIAVAVFSLILIQVIRAILDFKSPQQRNIFIGLVTGLVVLVLVILTSSFLRLSLYESAYGFSQLRTYSHVFIIWLGILLISVMLFEIIHKPGLFTNALLLMAVGFALSLNLLNVDATIAKQNIQRADNGMELDTSYLSSLSTDALPTLVEEFNSPVHSPTVHDEIGGPGLSKSYADGQWRRIHK
jgi:hypothetical protein